MRKPLVVLILFFCLGAVSIGCSVFFVTVAERKVQLRIECRNKHISLYVNGVRRLSEPKKMQTASGQRIGVYMFRSYGSLRQNQSWFQNLQVRVSNASLDLSLLGSVRLESVFEATPGWTIVPGKGLTLEGQPGSRGVCLLKNVEAQDFQFQVDVINLVDVGIFFHAVDPANGHLLIVRRLQNDIILTDVKNGKPGPIQSLASLGEIKTGLEAFRLAGLVGHLVINIVFFLGILWVLASRSPKFTGLNFFVRSMFFLKRLLEARVMPIMLFCFTFFFLALVSRYAFYAVPHIADETAYLFQAKIFSVGRLWAPAPENQAFFAFEHLIMNHGRWFGKYPPLFPVILSLGVMAGVPWLVNPLLGAFSGFIMYLLTRRLCGSRVFGVLAWIFLVSSPFFLLVNASMMSHGLALLLTLLFLYSACRGLSGEPSKWFFLSGFIMGALILTRPFTALMVFMPTSAYVFLTSLKNKCFSIGLRNMAAMGAGMLPGFFLLLIWQHTYLPETHHTMDSLYTLYDESDRLGFGPDRGTGARMTWGSWGHTPSKALRSLYLYSSYTINHFLGWPLGLSFAFAGISLFFGQRRRTSLLLLSLFIFLAAGHLLYWATEHLSYGARYWFSALAGLIPLTVMGIKIFWEGTFKSSLDPIRSKCWSSWVLFVVLIIFFGWNLAFYLPQRLKECHTYGNVSADLKNAVEMFNLKNALVFVKSENFEYNDAFFMNDPFMRSNVIFARDLGKRNRVLIEQYPGYQIYYWDKEDLQKVVRPKFPAKDLPNNGT